MDQYRRAVCSTATIANHLADDYRLGELVRNLGLRIDLQLFFSTGLCVLIVIRVLAFRLWLHSVEFAAPSTTAIGTHVDRTSNESGEQRSALGQVK
jgi:hypothetical protein